MPLLHLNVEAVQQNRHLLVSCTVYYFSLTGFKDTKYIKEFAASISQSRIFYFS